MKFIKVRSVALVNKTFCNFVEKKLLISFFKKDIKNKPSGEYYSFWMNFQKGLNHIMTKKFLNHRYMSTHTHIPRQIPKESVTDDKMYAIHKNGWILLEWCFGLLYGYKTDTKFISVYHVYNITIFCY